MPHNVEVIVERSYDEWNGSKVAADPTRERINRSNNKTQETNTMIMMFGGIAITIVIIVGVLALVMIATSL